MVELLSVPANLLLCGEYAVTRPGRIGVAVALERRVVFFCEPAARFSFLGRAPGGTYPLTADSLPAAVATACREFFPDGQLPAVRIEADSTALFAADGRKLGLGSSAAVAVGLAAALFHLTTKKEMLPEAVFRAALAGHRAWQGGGSGYDVAASLYGGCGCFTGGELPRWEGLAWRPEWHLALVPGEAPQSSGSAVRAFNLWERDKPEAARRLLDLSDKAANKFANAVRAGALTPGVWAAVRRSGRCLGRAAGFPADPPALAAALARFCACGWTGKASGAGGELGVAFQAGNAYALKENGLPGTVVPVAMEGIRWNL